MKRGSQVIKLSLTTISFALVIIAWMFFAPKQFGGDTAYIIVAGTSMLPRFELGDLVIIKEKETYDVGDIVAYEHPEIGPIFHRIVDRAGQHFILQGDNNDFLDSYLPEKEEIIGKLWVHLPGLGKFLVYLRTPFVFSILVIATGFISYISIFGGTSKRLSRQHRPKVTGVHMSDRENTIEMFFVLAIIAIGSLILGIAAYTRPTQITTSEMVPYEHTGAFFYTAEAVDDIYDQETVQPGEPLFRRLTDDFTVAFSYRLVSPEITGVKGSYQMVAVVRDANGWKRTISLEPETDFDGASFSISSTVDLDQVQAIIDTLEAQTGYVRGQYTLSIKPIITVSGILEEESFEDSFSPTLDFLMDDVQVKLGSNEPESVPTMKASKVGMISQKIVVPNKIKIISFEITVLTAQIISLIGLVVSAALMTFLGIRLRTTSPQSFLPHLDARLKPMVVSLDNPAQLADFLQGKTLVDVAALSDLLKVAERAQAMIMHQDQESAHHYFIQSDGLVYHYAVQASQPVGTADNLEIQPETTSFFGRLFGRFRRTNTSAQTEEDMFSADEEDLLALFDHDETTE